MSSSRIVADPAALIDRPGTVVAVVRRCGVRRLLADSFRRFRCGDGFSHARALALLLCLAVVPLLIALTGLAQEIGAAGGGRILVYTALALTPGSSDALIRRLLTGEPDGDTGEVALTLGLVSGMIAVTGAMAQIERGANRIYGIRRDRPTVHKYARGLLLAAVAGVPAFSGFVLVVAGEAVTRAWERTYGWNTSLRHVWSLLYLPVALMLTIAAVAIIFRVAPRRRQPSLRWLLPGILISTTLWLGATALLGVYTTVGTSFSEIYGPLTGIVALLLWANASGVAFFFGVACCAQIEAARNGDDSPCEPDRWAGDLTTHSGR